MNTRRCHILLEDDKWPSDLYIDPDDGDDYNLGSATGPVKTWDRLWELVPDKITQNITIHLLAGTYPRVTLPSKIVDAGALLTIEGEVDTLDEFTPTWPSDWGNQVQNPGASWTTNEFAGKYLYFYYDLSAYSYPYNWDFYYPILSNTSDTITVATNMLTGICSANMVKVVDFKTIIDQESVMHRGGALGIIGWSGGGDLVVKQLKIIRQNQHAVVAHHNSLNVIKLYGLDIAEVDSSVACSFGLGSWDNTADLELTGARIFADQAIYGGSNNSMGSSGGLYIQPPSHHASSSYAFWIRDSYAWFRYSMRVEDFSYMARLEGRTAYNNVYYSTDADKVLGNVSQTVFYLLDGASVKIYGGSNYPMTRGAGDVKLGDGTIKAFTDASAGETTQFTRWIKG